MSSACCSCGKKNLTKDEIGLTKKLINKKVLLIDDIYTTGSTANECCKVLEEAGAIKIGVMTIAKD